jgi:hypothetical protein
MEKFGAINEEDAEEFVSKVHYGHNLIKEYNRLCDDSSSDNKFKRKQIEIELNDLDNWFNGKKSKL